MSPTKETEKEELAPNAEASGESPKKRKSRDQGDDEEEDTAANERQEQRRIANDEKNAYEAAETEKIGEDEAKIDDTPARDEEKAGGEDTDAPPSNNEQQQQQETQAGVNSAAFAAALSANPFLAAGMPLAFVAGLDPSSPQANLNPFLMAQQGFVYPMQMQMMNATDQNRLFQGLVATRSPAAAAVGDNQQQPQGEGQENGAPAEADADAEGAPATAAEGAQAQVEGVPASLPSAAALQQLYQQGGGMEAAQMMMMGMPNPFMAGMRPELIGTARQLADVPLANLVAPGNAVAAYGGYRSPAIPLSLACDDEHLSEYQMLVRQQLELFEAEQEDVDSNTQGRKKPVVLGQVGLRCKHCAGLTLRQRGKGSVYYPTKLTGIYQAAQNMASSHLSDSCQCIDDRSKNTLMTLRQRKDTASGGKQYWADGAKALGLYETENGLRLNRQAAQQQPV